MTFEDQVEAAAKAAWVEYNRIPQVREDWMDDETWNDDHVLPMTRWPDDAGTHIGAEGFRDCARAALIAAGSLRLARDRADGRRARPAGALRTRKARGIEIGLEPMAPSGEISWAKGNPGKRPRLPGFLIPARIDRYSSDFAVAVACLLTAASSSTRVTSISAT
jgi:hypothetical protein